MPAIVLTYQYSEGAGRTRPPGSDRTWTWPRSPRADRGKGSSCLRVIIADFGILRKPSATRRLPVRAGHVRRRERPPFSSDRTVARETVAMSPRRSHFFSESTRRGHGVEDGAGSNRDAVLILRRVGSARAEKGMSGASLPTIGRPLIVNSRTRHRGNDPGPRPSSPHFRAVHPRDPLSSPPGRMPPVPAVLGPTARIRGPSPARAQHARRLAESGMRSFSSRDCPCDRVSRCNAGLVC